MQDLFNDIIGNNKAKKYLNKIISNKNISNTFLFYGPEGVGKGLFAKKIANHLLNEINDSIKLNKIEKNIHPDLHIYKPDGKSFMHNISSIKEMIRCIYMNPFESTCNVFIIHEAERMLASSANALLKTLEEPFKNNFIFILTNNIMDILPTIISRCLKIEFTALDEAEIMQRLHSDNSELSSHYSKKIAYISQGSISNALYITSNEFFKKKINILIDILSKNKISNYVDLLDMLKEFDDEPIEYRQKYLKFLFSYILLWFRDIEFLRKGYKDKIFFQEHLEALENQKDIKRYSLNFIHSLVNEAILGLERNLRIRICLSNLFLKVYNF